MPVKEEEEILPAPTWADVLIRPREQKQGWTLTVNLGWLGNTHS